MRQQLDRLRAAELFTDSLTSHICVHVSFYSFVFWTCSTNLTESGPLQSRLLQFNTSRGFEELNHCEECPSRKCQRRRKKMSKSACSFLSVSPLFQPHLSSFPSCYQSAHRFSFCAKGYISDPETSCCFHPTVKVKGNQRR